MIKLINLIFYQFTSILCEDCLFTIHHLRFCSNITSLDCLAGNEQELQSILDIVHNLTSNDLTRINPSKSELVPLTKVKNNFSVYLRDNKIENKNEANHLGLI